MARGGKDTNIIGDNGERYAAIRLTQGQLFDVIELGGKTPAFDLLCRINDAQKPYQFLVQVKARETAPIFTKKRPVTIKTPVPDKKYKPLLVRPLPTYVAGVDNTTGDVFIAAAFQTANNYKNDMPTTYKLSLSDKTGSLANLQRLKNDVIDYWDGLNIQVYKPGFNSALV
jgi:hypothetical protein